MISEFRRPAAGESGSSLIMVLALMSFLSMVVAALLSLGGSSVASSVATRERAKTVYDVDSALQAGVNAIRASTYNNGETQNCPTINFTGPNTGDQVTVICQGGAETGADAGLVPVNQNNRPGSAVLTTGTGAETGIDNQAAQDHPLRIKGKVYSNSSIETDPGNIEVEDAPAVARGSCSGEIASTPAAKCNDDSDDPEGEDPAIAHPQAYAQPTQGLTYRRVPQCPDRPGATVTFSPGYYDDGVGITSLMETCAGHTFWFQPGEDDLPGIYFFDFHNGEGGVLQPGPHVWSVSSPDTRIVAGKPQGWDPNADTRQVPQIPGSCVSPLTSTDNDGVEFVFGGDSRLQITAGHVELCGHYSTDRPPLAIYGAKNGDDPPDTDSGALKTDDDADGSGDEITPAANVRNEDSQLASADVNCSAQVVTRSVTVDGYTPAERPPAGSLLKSAHLKVTHKETPVSGNGAISLKATVTANDTRAGAAAATVDIRVNTTSSLRTESIDITSEIEDEIHEYGFAGAKIRYDASAASGRRYTEDLDSIQLHLEWEPPSVRSEHSDIEGSPNCLAVKPYTGTGGSCALIDTKGPETRLYVQGTAYAPQAPVDIFLNNVSDQVFKSGVVARTIEAKITGSTDFEDPVIEVPSNSSGPAALDVYFSAYICPAGSDCTSPAPAAPWQLAGSAKATYTDVGAEPAAGARKVDIAAWSISR